MLTLINKYCIIRLTTKKYYFLIRKNMKHSEANNKDRLVDTWANKAMQARGEEPIISNKSQAEDKSPLVDTWANKAEQVRARADKFNQVEGQNNGTLAREFNSRRERIKHLAETATAETTIKDKSKSKKKVA